MEARRGLVGREEDGDSPYYTRTVAMISIAVTILKQWISYVVITGPSCCLLR